MSDIVILGVFVADTAYRADRQPKMGETILGTSFVLGPGGKGSNQAVAAAMAGGKVTFNLQTIPGVNNVVEYKNALTDAAWTPLTSFPGTGTIVPIDDSGPLPAARFYRARTGSP